ncbi:hypothetical protein PPTG_24617 [Phytophthora nicotianae INRA-310]|uniref:Uncharacterized protein n=1 Tax=Phytophthora nicotianae (strain INRA-310) TaxID=761204 RepID=W2PBM1_PHYN3|nr:hypothetical protein PPTG_24617 [Phytophthora nicotianae INRA-310]ETM98442.1 hypothetical protein PPTG_24617 [Phytophthora nicotianae INRA-310]
MIRMQVNAASGSQQVSGGELALAATDMGGGMDGKVFANNPGRRKSFAYSAQHLTSLVSKTLMQAYYGQKPRYSYFNGCSDGGREGVMEAMRYPNDFDGILAGAPAMLFQFQNSLHHGWLAMSNIDGPMPELPPMMRGPPPGPEGREHGPPRRGLPEHGLPASGPTAIVTASKLPLLHAAVVRACDALDGLVDGLLSDPRLCKFDPRDLLCDAESAVQVDQQCLTEAEVETIHKFYNGPVDPVTGSHLTVGNVQFGSELAWEGVFVPSGPRQPVMSAHIALAALRYLIFEPNPPESYSLNDLEFTEATVELLRARHPLLDATSPDLTAFKNAGGKLILWHGWSDEHISPRTTIAYHEALQKHLGAEQMAEFERLYLLPGVQHCGHGEGMAAIDLVTPLLEWVEQGSAPHKIITSTDMNNDLPPWMPQPVAPSFTRSRPVFPYPSLANAYSVGNLNLEGYKLPWEDEKLEYPSNLAHPRDILIQASNGASDYGNKFGEPVVTGFARSFGMVLPNGERREYIKPIMFSAGLGQLDGRHCTKGEPEIQMWVVKIGGPCYRIGMGGGAASSRIQDTKTADLDFNAVQRGDAEMECKLNKVIRACCDLGEKNPIVSIHDQGAGGNGNVLKEIVEVSNSKPGNANRGGARYEVRNILVGDDTLSVLEIWGAEYQENDALLLRPEHVELFDKICKRENCPYALLGQVTGDGHVVLHDSQDDSTPFDLDLDLVLGKMPQKTFTDTKATEPVSELSLPADITLRDALDRVLRLLAVGSKRFLTSKVDRSVSGLIAQQQTVGPLQMTLADCAVVAHLLRAW